MKKGFFHDKPNGTDRPGGAHPRSRRYQVPGTSILEEMQALATSAGPRAGSASTSKVMDPLVVLVPGMGELRSTYRVLAPALADAGYQAACADLRRHGDSDTTFVSYGDVETAADMVALIGQLGRGPAVIVGNSMAVGAAVLVAAGSPDLVSDLILLVPFVRDPS